MTRKVCSNGHVFEKTSNCPTCPHCMHDEVNQAYADGFPRIGSPAYSALKNAGITLSELPRYSEKQLLSIHGIGPKAVGILRSFLQEKGLSFAQ